VNNYKFIKYTSIYDIETVLYGLESDGVEQLIDGVKFVEVTPDFKRAMMVRADSLRPNGTVMKQY